MSDPRIRAVNQRRLHWARQGSPGDPPELICDDCGHEDCECSEKRVCDDCGLIKCDCEHGPKGLGENIGL